MTTHVYDDIQAFVLGALDEDQAQRVLEHTENCPTCAVLLADAMSTLYAAVAPNAERPIAGSRLPRVLLDAVPTRSHAPARQTAWQQPIAWWTVTAAAFAACLGLLLWNGQLRQQIIPVPIAALVHSHFTHHPLRGGSGYVKVIQAVDGQWLYVVADGLAPRTVYSLTETVGGQRRQVGIFSANAAGQAAAYWQQAPVKIDALVVRPEHESDPASELRWP